MHIFLDDERWPRNVTWIEIPTGVAWTVVRNYNDFVDLIESVDYITHVSFDHDLADAHYGPGLNGEQIDYSAFKEKTGMHCAKALVDWCMDRSNPLPSYTIHSLNPVGRENIASYLESYKKMYKTK